MSAPPPSPPLPPTPVSEKINPDAGSLAHVLRGNSFSAPSPPSLDRPVETDPVIIKLQEELTGLKEELKKLEKSPTSKQACEAMIKFMANEAEQNREPLVKPLDANSPWNGPASSCCVIA